MIRKNQLFTLSFGCDPRWDQYAEDKNGGFHLSQALSLNVQGQKLKDLQYADLVLR